MSRSLRTHLPQVSQPAPCQPPHSQGMQRDESTDECHGFPESDTPTAPANISLGSESSCRAHRVRIPGHPIAPLLSGSIGAASSARRRDAAVETAGQSSGTVGAGRKSSERGGRVGRGEEEFGTGRKSSEQRGRARSSEEELGAVRKRQLRVPELRAAGKVTQGSSAVLCSVILL